MAPDDLTSGVDRALSSVSPTGARARNQVIFVCVDHRSRSVLAERLLMQHSSHGGTPNLDILGVGGHKTRPAVPPDRLTLRVLNGLELEAPRGPARQLTAKHLASASVLLTFEREHRTEVFQYAPRMLDRCFTLTELAAIARARPDLCQYPFEERVASASRLRHIGRDAPDIPSTWKRSASAHRAAARMISSAVADIAPFLLTIGS